MKSGGENWVGGEPQIRISKTDWLRLSIHPDALVLYGILQAAHRARDAAFAISPKAMAEADVIRGWSVGRYRKARDWLVDLDAIVKIKHGGRGPKDPHLFSWPANGPGRVPDITSTLLRNARVKATLAAQADRRSNGKRW